MLSKQRYEEMSSRVPERFVSGPLVYDILINYVCNIIKFSDYLFCFADDLNSYRFSSFPQDFPLRPMVIDFVLS